jgi:hypothetical protein
MSPVHFTLLFINFSRSSESKKPLSTMRMEQEQCTTMRPTIAIDSRTMRCLRVLTFLALLLSSVSASSRNWFGSKAVRKPTSVLPLVVGSGSMRCSLASATTRHSQPIVLNQHQEHVLLSLRAGYQDQQQHSWQDDDAFAEEEQVEDEDNEEDEEEAEDSYSSSSSSCHPPSIALGEMAMALRWTGELNRRMMIASTARAQDTSTGSFMSLSPPSYHSSSSLLVDVRGGERAMTVEQLQLQRQQLSNEDESSPLTIFHAKAPFQGGGGEDANTNPQRQRRRGALRWGPDLEAYLEHLVVDVFALKDAETRSLALSLAMMYMDRATSVETPRGRQQRNGATTPSCPYCTPRTVHRLILTSLYLAVQAILQQKLAMSNDENDDLMTTFTEESLFLPPRVLPSHGRCSFYETKLASLGIPQDEMHHMIAWMKAALGDAGFFVTSDHMREWRRTWERSWFTTTTTTTTPTPTTTTTPTPTTTTPEMSIKNHDGGPQEETAPEIHPQEQPAATTAFVPHRYHYDSSLPEAAPPHHQQQHYTEQPVAPANHQYGNYMPPPRRQVATTAF